MAREIKERCCFVSQDLNKDFACSRAYPRSNSSQAGNCIVQQVHLSGNLFRSQVTGVKDVRYRDEPEEESKRVTEEKSDRSQNELQYLQEHRERNLRSEMNALLSLKFYLDLA